MYFVFMGQRMPHASQHTIHVRNISLYTAVYATRHIHVKPILTHTTYVIPYRAPSVCSHCDLALGRYATRHQAALRYNILPQSIPHAPYTHEYANYSSQIRAPCAFS